MNLKWGEIDLVAEDHASKQRWVIEVRGRIGKDRPPVLWTPYQKFRKIKKMTEWLSFRSQRYHRALFIQAQIVAPIIDSVSSWEVRAVLKEFELTQD